MHYFVGDWPGELPPIQPLSLPLEDFDSVDAEIVNPDGTLTEPLAVALDQNGIIVVLDSVHQVGVHQLLITLIGPASERALPSIPLVVEDPATPWHTIDSARSEWDGAPVNDLVLYELLISAREQVLAFAPAVVDVPVRYRAAQLMQARNTWNAHKRNPGSDQYGSPDFQVSVFPLDWHVRQLLRPATGTPVVG